MSKAPRVAALEIDESNERMSPLLWGGSMMSVPGGSGSSNHPHPPRRGDYGFDAPYAPLLMALGGVACSPSACGGCGKARAGR